MKTLVKLQLLGGVSFAACAFHAVMSWFLAAGHAYAPRSGSASQAYFQEVGNKFNGLSAFIQNAFATGGVFTEWGWLAGTYSAPLIIQTICAITLLWVLRRTQEVDIEAQAVANHVLFWAVGFAAVSIFAMDVLAPDIWLAIPWGRMVLEAGGDPYLIPYPISYAADVPLDFSPTIRMTYGPLWAAIAAAAVALGGGDPTAAWFVVKLVLLASWIVILVSVWKLSAAGGWRRQAYALAIVGWLPVGFHYTVAEGHNDGFMIALFMVWLCLMQRASAWGPLAFLGAVMAKYVVAPLVIIDGIYHIRAGTLSVSRYLLRAAIAVVVAIPLIVFLFSEGRLLETREMMHWRFLEPYDILLALERSIGVPLPKTLVPRLIFGAIAGWSLYRLWRRPEIEHVWGACLSMLAAALFAGVGHVWPWFYVWVLPLAALLPGHLMARFVIGAAIVAPFSILRVRYSEYLGDGNSIVESMMVYGAAFGLVGFTIIYRMWRNYSITRPIEWRK